MKVTEYIILSLIGIYCMCLGCYVYDSIIPLLELQSYGLIADVIGVIMLFIYDLPTKWKDSANLKTTESKETLEEDRKYNKKHKIGSYSGLCLLILGFTLQFLSTLIN
jgi:hypothetical protein